MGFSANKRSRSSRGASRPMSQRPVSQAPRNGKGNSQGQQQDTSQLLHKLNKLQSEVGRVAKALSNAGQSQPTGQPSGKGQSQGKNSRLDLRIQGVGLQKKQPLMLRPKNESNAPRNRAPRVSTGNRVMTFGRIQKPATLQGGIRTRRSQRARQIGEKGPSVTLAGRVVAPQASQVLRARNRLQTQKNAGQGFILKKPINQIRVEKSNSNNSSAKTSNKRKKNRMPQAGQPLVMRPLRIQVVKNTDKNAEKKGSKGSSKGASNPMKRRNRPRKERKDKEGGKDAAEEPKDEEL